MTSDFEGIECTMFLIGAVCCQSVGGKVFLAFMCLVCLVKYNATKRAEELRSKTAPQPEAPQ